ncbi:MAG: ABC transporter permease [Candidatus Eisenbacteria bacterium]|jgi:lipoprotein-releasing system permease protein|nr:ABC transporter permease [Candidatus Eisenbacteria bacterium]
MMLALRAAAHLAFSPSGRLYRVISLLCVAGIGLAVAALVVVMSVINGFRSEFARSLLRAEPHVTVRAMGRQLGDNDSATAAVLRQLPGVRSVDPYFLQEVLVAKSKRVGGGLFRGVPRDGPFPSATTVVAGRWPPDRPEDIALGKELAARVGAVVGDSVVLATFLTVGEGSALSTPRVMPFRIGALLDLGVFQYNNSLAVADLGVVQSFYRCDGLITGLELSLEDPLASDPLARIVADSLGFPFYATSWRELNAPMFAMLTLQKRALFLILTLMIAVAGANVVSGLTALVSARGRDIGILMAMGVRRKGITLVFLWVGAILGMAGLAAGLLLATGLIALANGTNLVRLAADVYQIERLPLSIQALDLAVVSGTTLAVAVVCTLLPALRASRLLPIEILRYE